MKSDRRELKRRAAEIIRGSRPSAVAVGVVYTILCIIIGFLSSEVFSVNVSESEALNYLQYVSGGDLDGALRYLESMKPPAAAYFLRLLLSAVKAVLAAGFIVFLLNTIRGTGPCFGNLLDGFGFLVKILLLSILEAVFVFLWSLLFVIPGIIAAYRYRQAIYLLVDDPSRSPMQCIRESRSMMKGRKGELFVLDLSFFGWALLAAIPVIGYAVRVWTVPYISMTKALYFEKLRVPALSVG